jgi:hypothetical protein
MPETKPKINKTPRGSRFGCRQGVNFAVPLTVWGDSTSHTLVMIFGRLSFRLISTNRCESGRSTVQRIAAVSAIQVSTA